MKDRFGRNIDYLRISLTDDPVTEVRACWALLAALILDMASKAFPDDGLYRMLSLNLMEVLRGIFLVEGLSLLWYFMSAYKVNKALRVILTLFCAFFAPVSYVLSMIGIFDIWYDLRRRIKLRRK